MRVAIRTVRPILGRFPSSTRLARSYSLHLWKLCTRHLCTAMTSLAMPVLLQRKEDGSEEQIAEEDLYRYRRYRWLRNEAEQLAQRYRKFNLFPLIDEAIKASGSKANKCVKIVKCTEGQYNKVFLMTMDDGMEVIAKLPNPNAGPKFYTTASEVATREFLTSVMHLAIPRIHGFSADPQNPVGAEYIIEEKAQGKPLGSLWHQWQREDQLNVVAQVVKLQKRLTSVSFARHGCLYYKHDLEQKGLPSQSLDARALRSESSQNLLASEFMSRFSLGPLTAACLWDGERSGMDLDRGPWSNSLSYMASMAINEIEWAKAYAKPRINAYRSVERPDSPNDYIDFLQRYLRLIPHISPRTFWTSFAHPDLHLDNIFVDPQTKTITHIIDWQSAAISEPFFHSTPTMLLPISSSPSTRRPQGGRSLDSAEDDPLSVYRKLSAMENPHYWAAINLRNGDLLAELASLVTGAWSRDDVFSFRHSLLHLAARWEEIAKDEPLPIRFTDEELRLHESELELIEGLGQVLNQLHNSGLIPLGGMVLRERFDQAAHINKNVKQMFLDSAQSTSQKALHAQIWPYQDQDDRGS